MRRISPVRCESMVFEPSASITSMLSVLRVSQGRAIKLMRSQICILYYRRFRQILCLFFATTYHGFSFFFGLFNHKTLEFFGEWPEIFLFPSNNFDGSKLFNPQIFFILLKFKVSSLIQFNSWC